MTDGDRSFLAGGQYALLRPSDSLIPPARRALPRCSLRLQESWSSCWLTGSARGIRYTRRASWMRLSFLVTPNSGPKRRAGYLRMEASLESLSSSREACSLHPNPRRMRRLPSPAEHIDMRRSRGYGVDSVDSRATQSFGLSWREPTRPWARCPPQRRRCAPPLRLRRIADTSS